MAVRTTYQPVEVLTPPVREMRLRELMICWRMESPDGEARLEIRVIPDQGLCEATLTRTDGSTQALELPTPRPAINVVADAESNLVHVDVADVLAASLEPARGGSHATVMYARASLTRHINEESCGMALLAANARIAATLSIAGST